MIVRDLGTMTYRDAWALQEQAHQRVLEGGEELLLLGEHPPVITFGRRAETQGQKNLIATAEHLQTLGVERVQSDRGGDVTFHGRGQLVAYPIVRLKDHQLMVGSYVRTLLEIVIKSLATFDIVARKDESGIGVWVDLDGQPAKICALGVRIKRGVSMHGIALNVTTDLSFFDLIVPCGLAGRGVTSMQQVLGKQCPTIARVRQEMARSFTHQFSGNKGASSV